VQFGRGAPLNGSLTQRDRDPPFKRCDPGAIPGRPTNLPVTHRQRCARLVKRERWGATPQAGSIMESEAGRACTRLLTDGCRHAAWPSSGPLSANLEGEVRGAHPRLESEWHPHGCVDRDRPPSANSGCPLGGDWSPKPVSRVRFLDGPPGHSGVGCWHPSCALNAAHAGPIPAA